MEQSAQANTAATRSVLRSRFYPILAGLILLIVLTGFSQTLYLRAFFEVPEIPPYLYVHGALLTSWFVLFFVQTLLVEIGSTGHHRKLGIAAVTIGAVIPMAGLMATFGIPGRIVSAGFEVASLLPAITPVIVANSLEIAFFSAALLSAVLLRRNREAHSRLMLWATLFLVGPAIARISRWPIFPDVGEQSFYLIIFSILIAIIVAHEVFRYKRVHPATIIAVVSWISIQLVQPYIVGSEWGQNLVRSLA